MSTDLTVIEAPSLPSLLIEEDLDAAAEFLVAEKAGSTQAAYRSDYKIFVSCLPRHERPACVCFNAAGSNALTP